MADYELNKSAQDARRGRSWKVVGISGVSGSGKTTLATRLASLLPTTTAYLSQDQYILPDDFPGHLRAPPPFQGLNKDSIQSIATDKMEADLRRFFLTEDPPLEPMAHGFFADRKRFVGSALRSQNPICGKLQESDLHPVLLLDGFVLFNHAFIPPICDLRFFLTLTKEQCWDRRSRRTFTLDFMSTRDYFESCMWPTYERNLEEVVAEVKDVEFLDGGTSPDDLFEKVFSEVLGILKSS